MEPAGDVVEHADGDAAGDNVEYTVATAAGKVYLSPGRAGTSTSRKELRTTPQKSPTHKRSNIRRRTDSADNSIIPL